MKKVVINNCFGGFGLSPLATKMYAEAHGKPCYFFKLEYKNNKGIYHQVSIDECKGLFWSAFNIQNPESFAGHPERWAEMTSEEKTAHNKAYSEASLYYRHISREDPILIKIIEEIGSKAASGSCSSLEIIEVPDDIDYEISEYDGNERIAEKHRTWG